MPNKEYYAKCKNAAFALLGEVCQYPVGEGICGFSDRRALNVDHKKGGGTKEFKKLGGTNGIYRNVLRHPEKYQILCCNHNWIKRYENGELPKNSKS